MTDNGLILKGIGGFYYVETADGVFECKAKGKFRKEKRIPLAGDRVRITVRDGEENTIDEIYERKNCLKRPPVANIDTLMIVVSVADPAPNTLVIDKMTVLAEKNRIEPVIVITKTDLGSCDALSAIYEKTGYRVVSVSGKTGEGTQAVKELLKNRLTAFTGNSGVGKSTLINAVCPGLALETNEISTKLGRGRHTTRQAEIFHVADGLVIDTAGFSSLDFLGEDVILKDDLQYYFPEFEKYLGQCRFTSCTHIGDKGCKICEAVENGKISRSRHESYIALYNEVKDLKEWQL